MGKADEDVVIKIVEDDLDELRKLAGFPSGALLVAPDDADKPQFCPEGLVIFYEYPFRNGFKFPFSPLTHQIMEMYNVSPGQLMPLVWRICWLLEKATVGWKDKITLGDLCKCYEFRKKEMGRVTMYRRRPGYMHLVEGADIVNDRGWKSRYFFVDKRSVGEAGRFLKDG